MNNLPEDCKIISQGLLGPEILILKGKRNKYGSKTGPYLTCGGWGTPAIKGDKCPKCGSKNFKYVGGFAEGADNICGDCRYEEGFMY